MHCPQVHADAGALGRSHRPILSAVAPHPPVPPDRGGRRRLRGRLLQPAVYSWLGLGLGASNFTNSPALPAICRRCRTNRTDPARCVTYPSQYLLSARVGRMLIGASDPALGPLVPFSFPPFFLSGTATTAMFFTIYRVFFSGAMPTYTRGVTCRHTTRTSIWRPCLWMLIGACNPIVTFPISVLFGTSGTAATRRSRRCTRSRSSGRS